MSSPSNKNSILKRKKNYSPSIKDQQKKEEEKLTRVQILERKMTMAGDSQARRFRRRDKVMIIANSAHHTNKHGKSESKQTKSTYRIPRIEKEDSHRHYINSLKYPSSYFDYKLYLDNIKMSEVGEALQNLKSSGLIDLADFSPIDYSEGLEKNGELSYRHNLWGQLLRYVQSK